ncbi:MAG: hypothetical protein U9P10_06675, partial [Thermodesulfobacteriota bacterium]|nr:hypothetical protein [Thermodesulfobacteriota bacterium]
IIKNRQNYRLEPIARGIHNADFCMMKIQMPKSMEIGDFKSSYSYCPNRPLDLKKLMIPIFYHIEMSLI